MCNLYRLRASQGEVAKTFAAEVVPGANCAEDVYPGYSGMVVAHGRVGAMTWGFPVVLRGKQGQPLKPKPVTNARDDKLHTPFWRESFSRRRCLIPVSQWAEPEEAGRMTRTWYGMSAGEVFAIGGIWRPTAEWGQTYAMVMVDSSPVMAEAHDRMPVILRPEQWGIWLQGAPEDAFALVRTWPGGLCVERTSDRWAGR
jgi:putative SOS response-associated peptidase YedK